jgi:hypothetical protein
VRWRLPSLGMTVVVTGTHDAPRVTSSSITVWKLAGWMPATARRRGDGRTSGAGPPRIVGREPVQRVARLDLLDVLRPAIRVD